MTGDRGLGAGYTDSQELSAGQWQRIAVARALNRRSPIIILDEPTASMDPITEMRVLHHVVQSLTEHSIIIIVAHRVSAVMRCDRVLVMDAGSIVEDGPPRELLERKGRFHDMYHAQLKILNQGSELDLSDRGA